MRRLFRTGDPFVWLTGGALAACLAMVLGLVLLIVANGLGCFWPSDVLQVTLDDGSVHLGQLRERQAIPDPDGPPGALPRSRIQLQVGNRDLTGQDFVWVDEQRIRSREAPVQAVLLERQEWGPFYGTLCEVRVGDRVVASGTEEAWLALQPLLMEARGKREAIRRLEKVDIGRICAKQEQLRLRKRRRESAGRQGEIPALDEELAELQKAYLTLESRLAGLRSEMLSTTVELASASGERKRLPVVAVIRACRPNAMSWVRKLGLYLERVWEYVSGDPRESNTEGGVFPAIFGTVMMVFLMTLAVVPLGVLAALYLREYATQGTLVRMVRIAVNNLAGVPSIVFGVFGLGFFVYFVGGRIDAWFFPDALPTPTFGTGGILWASLTLALLTVPVVIVATEEGLAAVPRDIRHGSLALGATKFETTWRIVLPSAMPGILTGVILAMARAAGEVAPLMITGVVKLAPTLPVDGQYPFLHLERKFMHLGFHIYDVGFQSPNVEAAVPMVYTTSLLLLVVVVALNLVAIIVRNRLRRRLRSSHF